VQLKPAGPVYNGFIQFTVPGGIERRSSFGKHTRDAFGDENSVVFSRGQMPAFLALRDAIEEVIVLRSGVHASAPATTANVAEQIGQLAALRDQGILTDAEFETKKTELLARM
jgi:hypothetical protein